MKSLAGLIAAVLLCTAVEAGEIDLSFNSDAVRFFYIHDFADSNLQADFGVLNNSDEGTIANASLYLTGFASDGQSPLQAGIGARTGYIDGDDSDQSGIPLAPGGWVRYVFSGLDRVSIRADVYYAPDILTIMDLEKYRDYGIRLAYSILREADIYVGARYVKGRFDNGSEALVDNGMHVGMHIRF